MSIRIVYFIFILTYIAVPFFYKSRHPAMLRFYLRMTFSRKFRRCFSLCLLAMLMVYHFYHLNVFGNVYELALSSAFCLLLYSHKNMERMFDFLQWKRRSFWMATLTIILLFIPHMLPIAVTSGTLLLGAMFYPSVKIRTAPPDELGVYLMNPEGIVNDYFQWRQSGPDVD